MDCASTRADADTVRITASPDYTWANALHALRDGGAFCTSLIGQMVDAPWAAFFWECPPLTPELDQPFECVLKAAPGLAGVQVDADSFREHTENHQGSVAFANLGGDAVLVAPCPAPGVPLQDYAHLAAFVRGCAGAEAVEAFMHHVTERVLAVLGSSRGRPIWLSTNGMGVSWLHARIDQRPKYVTHQPYRTTGRRRDPGGRGDWH